MNFDALKTAIEAETLAIDTRVSEASLALEGQYADLFIAAKDTGLKGVWCGTVSYEGGSGGGAYIQDDTSFHYDDEKTASEADDLNEPTWFKEILAKAAAVLIRHASDLDAVIADDELSEAA